MNKLIVKKGYTITVDSWENDGDYNNTNSKTVETEEEAKAYYNIMQTCKSFGNNDSFSGKDRLQMRECLAKNPILLEKQNIEFEVFSLEMGLDEIQDIFMEYAYDLLGHSEYYSCRVMEKCTVTYSPEDIYLEEIKF